MLMHVGSSEGQSGQVVSHTLRGSCHGETIRIGLDRIEGTA
jgi:hypothetical protein